MYKCSLQAPVLLLCLCLCLGEPQNRQRNNRNNRNNNRRPAARQNTFLRNGVTRNGSRDRRGTEVYPGCDGKVCLPEAILCADRQQKVGGLFWIRVISSELVQCHQRIALTHHFTHILPHIQSFGPFGFCPWCWHTHRYTNLAGLGRGRTRDECDTVQFKEMCKSGVQTVSLSWEYHDDGCCSCSVCGVISRASNEGSRRFHNHGEGPY